jgi:membrane protein DedA with SNARE-associated domain
MSIMSWCFRSNLHPIEDLFRPKVMSGWFNVVPGIGSVIENTWVFIFSALGIYGEFVWRKQDFFWEMLGIAIVVPVGARFFIHFYLLSDWPRYKSSVRDS